MSFFNSSPPEIPSRCVVLLAEDEPMIRMMMAEVLADEGFEVLEAAHSGEALDILRSQGDQVRVLFTDIHMPGGMDGLGLAHHVGRTWPGISVLLASGRARPADHQLPPGGRFLSKPYCPERAAQQIRELAANAV